MQQIVLKLYNEFQRPMFNIHDDKLIDSKGNIHIMCQSNFKALQANLVRSHIIKSQDSN